MFTDIAINEVPTFIYIYDIFEKYQRFDGKPEETVRLSNSLSR